MKYLIVSLAVLLAGCSTTTKVERVEVPVYVECVRDVPVRPIPTLNNTFPVVDEYTAVLFAKALAKDYKQLNDYTLDLEVAISGCLRKGQ